MSQIFTIILTLIAVTLALVILYHRQAAVGLPLIGFLFFWFPLENTILKFIPLELYSYVRYLPEVLLYALCLVAWIEYAQRTGRVWPKTPLNLPLFCFVLVAFVSLLVNWYAPTTWLLGLRQLLRFVPVAFFLMIGDYPKSAIRSLALWGLGMIALQAGIGIVQYLAGGRLDGYLFSTVTASVGNSALVGGIEEFWTPGQRIFATMGQYQLLASFLALGLLMLLPWFSQIKTRAERRWFFAVAGMSCLALVLTYSRASWLAVIVGTIVVSRVTLNNRRIYQFLGIACLVVVIYVGAFVLARDNISSILDKPTQSVAERLLEAVSYRSWYESYEAYGRIFFIVNTPIAVMTNVPLFGVGPGNYGGEVARALVNTTAYERLGLPFGISNVFGQIDNNWLSLWGETGTVGLLAWIAVFVSIGALARSLERRTKDMFVRNWARGVFGLVIGISIMGFFGPYFEIRPLMFYTWCAVGILLMFWREERQRMNFVYDL